MVDISAAPATELSVHANAADAAGGAVRVRRRAERAGRARGPRGGLHVDPTARSTAVRVHCLQNLQTLIARGAVYGGHVACGGAAARYDRAGGGRAGALRAHVLRDICALILSSSPLPFAL